MEVIIYTWGSNQEISSEQVVKSFIGSEQEKKHKKGADLKVCLQHHLNEQYDQPQFLEGRREPFIEAVHQEYLDYIN